MLIELKKSKDLNLCSFYRMKILLSTALAVVRPLSRRWRIKKAADKYLLRAGRKRP